MLNHCRVNSGLEFVAPFILMGDRYNLYQRSTVLLSFCAVSNLSALEGSETRGFLDGSFETVLQANSMKRPSSTCFDDFFQKV